MADSNEATKQGFSKKFTSGPFRGLLFKESDVTEDNSKVLVELYGKRRMIVSRWDRNIWSTEDLRTSAGLAAPASNLPAPLPLHCERERFGCGGMFCSCGCPDCKTHRDRVAAMVGPGCVNEHGVVEGHELSSGPFSLVEDGKQEYEPVPIGNSRRIPLSEVRWPREGDDPLAEGCRPVLKLIDEMAAQLTKTLVVCSVCERPGLIVEFGIENLWSRMRRITLAHPYGEPVRCSFAIGEDELRERSAQSPPTPSDADKKNG